MYMKSPWSGGHVQNSLKSNEANSELAEKSRNSFLSFYFQSFGFHRGEECTVHRKNPQISPKMLR